MTKRERTRHEYNRNLTVKPEWREEEKKGRWRDAEETLSRLFTAQDPLQFLSLPLLIPFLLTLLIPILHFSLTDASPPSLLFSFSLLLSHKTSVCLLPSFSSVRASNETGSLSCESLLFPERSSSSFGEKKFYPGLLHNLNTHLPSFFNKRSLVFFSCLQQEEESSRNNIVTFMPFCLYFHSLHSSSSTEKNLFGTNFSSESLLQ